MSKHNSRQIENIKVMLHKGDDGSSIEKIEKTGTDVLVDTYTITLTDGSKQTFNVTNGKGIESIDKTGTDVLIDTYTITFNDGDTQTFTVANGKGVVDVEKTSQGLVDTYTVTFNDGTDYEFTVTNGKAIVDIQVTQQGALEDIYTIYFNDDTHLDIPFYKANVQMDTALSDTSTNPVENRVIKQALDGKSDTGHTHDDRYYTESEINTKVSTLNTSISGKAPTNHASTATTYGVGNASNYGHVKVDSAMSTSSTNPVRNSVVSTAINSKIGTANSSAYAGVISIQNILSNSAPSDTMVASVSASPTTSINKIWNASTWSDEKIKKNIKDSEVDALDLINQLDAKEFDFIDKSYGNHTRLGYIAQDVEKLIPEMVIDTPASEIQEMKLKLIDYQKAVPFLIRAIQQQQEQIDELKSLLNKEDN